MIQLGEHFIGATGLELLQTQIDAQLATLLTSS